MKPLISRLLKYTELTPEERREVLEDLFVFGKAELLAHTWVWEFTQYDAERGARPPDEDEYYLVFEGRNVIYASANCG